MNAEEIKAEIKDLSYGIRFHRGQGDFHHGVADKRLASVKRLEAQLAETEKPELRHGDYGIGPAGAWIRVHGSTWWDTKRPSGPSHHDADVFIPYRLGNILDDLKSLSMPLKWFGTGEGDARIGCDITEGCLRIRNVDCQQIIAYVQKADIPDFILSVQRLFATWEKESPHA